LLSYLLTQAAFVGGFFTFKSLKKQSITSRVQSLKFEDEDLFIRITFIVCSSLYIFLQLLSYKVVGIPLLLGSHIDIYAGAGGWGILGRFLDVLKPISIFLFFYFLFKKSHSLVFYIYKYLFLILSLVFFAASGSRSEFMTFGLLFFCVVFLNGYDLKKYLDKMRTYEIFILLGGLCFVFFTIIFGAKGGVENESSIGIFLFRLVASGDVYYFAYPNNNIEHLNNSKPFLALFGEIFSTLRIIPRQDQPVVLGYQLYQLFGESDTVAGPNARHNVFGYVYFGFYGSIIFSYSIGLLLSFIRNKLFFVFRKNILSQLLFVLLYINLAVIETDPQMVVSNLENVLLILPVIAVITVYCYIIISNSERRILIYE
jgi:oligosaccharide repeat unit polymerase